MTFGNRPLLTLLLAVVLAMLVEVTLQVRAHILTGQSVLNVLLGQTIYADDPVTGLKLLRPNAMIKGLRSEIRSNSWGLRSEEVGVGRTPGEVRIALLGASSLMGAYAPTNEQQAAYLLEGLLKRRTAAGARVINGGVAGLTVREQVQLLQRRLIPAGIDAVIWYPGINDISCKARLMSAAGERARLEPPQMPWWMLTHGTIVKNTSFVRRSWTVSESPKASRELFRDVRRTVLHALEIARRADVQIALATTAHKFNWSQTANEREQFASTALYYRPCYSSQGLLREIDGLNQVIRAVARERGVPLIDVQSEFLGRLDMFGDATHFSVAGEARLAELFAHFLVPRLKVAGQR